MTIRTPISSISSSPDPFSAITRYRSSENIAAFPRCSRVDHTAIGTSPAWSKRFSGLKHSR